MSFANCQIISRDTDPRAYHAAKQAIPRGDPKYPVSPSVLKENARCPRGWLRGYQAPDTKAKQGGSLLDTRLLTPHLFDAAYAIRPPEYITETLRCPSCGSTSDAARCRKCGIDRVKASVSRPWNSNSATCSEWLDAQAAAGREVATREQIGEADAAIAALREVEPIARFLDQSDKQVLIRGVWQDEKSGLEIPAECLIDLAPRDDSEFAACLGDLKNTRSAHPDAWRRFVASMNYHVQGAFDLDMWNAATGQERLTWCFILSENYPPWEPGREYLSEDFLTLGRGEYRRLMQNYAHCVSKNHWPGYDENKNSDAQGWTVIYPDQWMAMQAAGAPNFADMAEAEESPDERPNYPDIHTPWNERERGETETAKPLDLIL